MATYTLDAKLPNGAYAHDSNLTEAEIRAAYSNAERLGIEILNVTRDDLPVSLTPDQIKLAFS